MTSALALTDRYSKFQLHAGRLQLRPLDAEDVARYHEILTEPGVRRFLLDDAVVTRDWVASEIERSRSLFDESGFGTWAVVLADRDVTIGFCGFRFFFEVPELQLFYGLDPAYWGHGFATEAARAVLDYAFNQLNFSIVLAATDPPNHTSISVLERLGMTPRGQVVHDVKPTLYFSMTRKEFEQLTNQRTLGTGRRRTFSTPLPGSSRPVGADLGLARATVRLHPYSIEWPVAFDREAERLRATVGDHLSIIEHVGSTAIPGMPAKPIIDMMAAVASLDGARALISTIEALDYEFRPDAPPPDRLFFAKGPRHRRTHHLSLTESTSEYWARTVRFRDYLRRHPETARHYRSLKADLARAFADDRSSYSAGKAAFVESVLALARSSI